MSGTVLICLKKCSLKFRTLDMAVRLNVYFHLINKRMSDFTIENSFWSSVIILTVELKFGPHAFSKILNINAFHL